MDCQRGDIHFGGFVGYSMRKAYQYRRHCITACPFLTFWKGNIQLEQAALPFGFVLPWNSTLPVLQI
jgi:hypothetical protein